MGFKNGYLKDLDFYVVPHTFQISVSSSFRTQKVLN